MANASSKEEKRKIAKEIGVIEKKNEKKSSTKSTLNGSSERKPESRPKAESKILESKTNSESKIRPATKSKPGSKSVQKFPKNDRPNEQKRSSSTDKRSLSMGKQSSSSTENAEGKRFKESNDSIRSKVMKKDEPLLSVVKSVSKHPSMPLKASHTIGAKANAATTVSSKNVMNQVHNVTISSPPLARREFGAVEMEQLTEQTVMEYEQLQRQKHKEQQVQQKQLEKRQLNDSMEMEQKHEDSERSGEQLKQQQKAKQNVQQTDELESFPKRGRTRTRTLDENEIVLLKSKITSNLMPASNGSEPQSLVSEYYPDEIKPPISFEVILDGAKHANHTNKWSVKGHGPVQSVVPVTANGSNASDNESDDYEDDFESYESDFESEVEDEEDDENNENDEESEESAECDTDDNVVSTASRHPFETGHSIENSEFDSGSFELKILSSRTRNYSEQPAASHREQKIEAQHDSGIENYSNTVNASIQYAEPTQNNQLNSLDLNNKTFDNISDMENEGANSLGTVNKSNSGKSNKKKSRLSKRGEELLSKITLDVMNYVLFDSKPIPYEVFMKIYGNTNTAQVAVQTHNDRIDQECQSDAITTQSIWSQYPISFYTKHIKRSDFGDYKNGCGIVVEQNKEKIMEKLYQNCEHSLNLIRKSITNDETNGENDGQIIANIYYEKLNRFLLESEITLSRILNCHTQTGRRKLNEAILPISNGFLTLNVNIDCVNKRVDRTFVTDALPGFLFTLHCDIDTDLNVIAMWNLTSLHSPVCLLSVWSKVLCLEIHSKIKDIVFAGLNDG